MDITQLQYYQIIAKYQNLTQAANEIHITQPALSLSLSKLEQELGVQLFDRMGRGLALNRYGETFLEFANSTLISLKNTVVELEALRGSPTLEVNLSYVSKNFLGLEISRFIEENPDISVSLKQIEPEEVERELSSPDCDFVIFSTGLPCKCPYSRLVFRDDRWVVAISSENPLSQKNEISLRDVADLKVVRSSQGTGFARMVEWLYQRLGLAPPKALDAASYESLPLIAGYNYIGIFNKMHSLYTEWRASSLELVKFVPLRADEGEWYSIISWRQDRRHSAAARLLIEHLKNAKLEQFVPSLSSELP